MSKSRSRFQRPLAALLLTSLTVCFASACTLYKSSDRDDFNTNGKAKAPSQKPTSSATPTTSLDGTENAAEEALYENPCGVFNTIPAATLDSVFGEGRRLRWTQQLNPKASTCMITNENPAVQDLGAIAILSCSWKPSDGQPIAHDQEQRLIAGDQDDSPNGMIPTEDDLRDDGFDVISSSVANDGAVRMNCEAYAPTQAVLSDRHSNNERARDAISAKFADLSMQLLQQTRTSNESH